MSFLVSITVMELYLSLHNIDVDECAIGRHNCSIADNEQCENEIGSYSCECALGFARLGKSCEGKNMNVESDMHLHYNNYSVMELIHISII